MNTSPNPHTVTTLVAEASDILESAGFRAVDPANTGSWRATEARVYEDPYSIVCIAVYETWASLSSLWRDDQAGLVELISNHFARSEAKAWDGYLVLLTPSVVSQGARQEAVDIRKNTTHVRKLLAVGDELKRTDVVRRTLLPLLPLESQDVQRATNVLHTLPTLLASHGVEETVTQIAVKAFVEQRPIIETIHTFVTREEES